jgi:hypothetical protein
MLRKLWRWLNPCWCIVVEDSAGNRLLVAQGDYRMGRFPGYRRVKDEHG